MNIYIYIIQLHICIYIALTTPEADSEVQTKKVQSSNTPYTYTYPLRSIVYLFIIYLRFVMRIHNLNTLFFRGLGGGGWLTG